MNDSLFPVFMYKVCNVELMGTKDITELFDDLVMS